MPSPPGTRPRVTGRDRRAAAGPALLVEDGAGAGVQRLPGGRGELRVELLAPVLKEELLFLEVEEGLGGRAENRAEGGGHLKGDEEKDPAPDREVAGLGHSEGPPGPENEEESEATADAPEGQEEETQEGARGAR